MPIKISPYRPLPFSLDGSEPPCRLGEDAPDIWVFWRENWSEYSRLTLNMSKAFKDVGLLLMDPFSEGVGERTWQIPSRDTRVRVGLRGVRDYGAEWVARAVAAALAGFPVPEPPEPKPSSDDPADDPVPGFVGGVGDGPADVGSLAPLAGLGMLGGQEDPSPAPPPTRKGPLTPLEELLLFDGMGEVFSTDPPIAQWEVGRGPVLRAGEPIQPIDMPSGYTLGGHGRG